MAEPNALCLESIAIMFEYISERLKLPSSSPHFGLDEYEKRSYNIGIRGQIGSNGAK